MSLKELLQEKLYGSIIDHGMMNGLDRWEKEINNLIIEILNDYMNDIIKDCMDEEK
jgi:hypothetical protein